MTKKGAETKIPYGRQWISEEDIRDVAAVLRSDWLTQGPTVELFEKALADYCGARFAVAVASGSAALHLAALAAGFGCGDEVITSPNTFVASANAIAHTGARPVLADIDPVTYCIDPAQISAGVTASTKGIIPVHFAGHPCDMVEISRLARERGLIVIEDAAHALGASYQVEGKNYRVGCCAHSDMTTFSFHPVKHLTTGEGGAVTTNSRDLYQKLLLLRTHGITRDPDRLSRVDGPWFYEQQELGFNYRITDIQCALGLSQIKRLDHFLERRRRIAACYHDDFASLEGVILPGEAAGCRSSWHLYVIHVPGDLRLALFNALRGKGLGVNVHYIPVHFHPFFREKYAFREGEFPRAETYYAGAITLPLYPAMRDAEVGYVVDSVKDALNEVRR